MPLSLSELSRSKLTWAGLAPPVAPRATGPAPGSTRGDIRGDLPAPTALDVLDLASFNAGSPDGAAQAGGCTAAVRSSDSTKLGSCTSTSSDAASSSMWNLPEARAAETPLIVESLLECTLDTPMRGAAAGMSAPVSGSGQQLLSTRVSPLPIVMALMLPRVVWAVWL
mmetsp:Transcript_71711/g.222402  ORF Transcript_71711/g.222402 Transcript_71711/m.222402 type:complete len:168 (-) Transcript_71711:275-778(-)